MSTEVPRHLSYPEAQQLGLLGHLEAPITELGLTDAAVRYLGAIHVDKVGELVVYTREALAEAFRANGSRCEEGVIVGIERKLPAGLALGTILGSTIVSRLMLIIDSASTRTFDDSALEVKEDELEAPTIDTGRERLLKKIADVEAEMAELEAKQRALPGLIESLKTDEATLRAHLIETRKLTGIEPPPLPSYEEFTMSLQHQLDVENPEKFSVLRTHLTAYRLTLKNVFGD